MRSVLLLVDLVFVLAFAPVVALLAGRIRDRSGWNAALIFGVYLLMCGAVYLLRRIEGGTTPPEEVGWLLAVQGLFFGIFVGYAAWESAGMVDAVLATQASEGHYGAMLAILSGIGLAFLYPTLLVVPIDATLRVDPFLETAIRVGALVALNVGSMLVFAVWDVTFADTIPYESVQLGGKLLIFASTYVFYWLFFAAPRMAPVALDFSRLGLATALLSSGYWVWRSLERVGW